MLEFEEIAAEDPFTRAVAIGLLVIVIVVILIVVIKSVRAYLKNRPKKNEIDEISDDEILIDTIENIAPEEELLGKSHDFGTGYERQVRKRFYDKTRRAMRKGLPVSDASTPGQIESALLANGDKEIASLRKEYVISMSVPARVHFLLMSLLQRLWPLYADARTAFLMISRNSQYPSLHTVSRSAHRDLSQATASSCPSVTPQLPSSQDFLTRSPAPQRTSASKT